MKKIIAIDFDGVISNPYHLKLKYLREYGYNISINQTPYGQCVKTGIVNEKHYKTANNTYSIGQMTHCRFSEK